jgi:hypothetical protein
LEENETTAEADEAPEKEGKEAESTAAERVRLNRKIKAFFAVSKSDKDTGHDKRVKRYKAIDDYHIHAKHWGDDEDTTLPRIPLTWYHRDSLSADIGKRPHNPKIVAEEASSFPKPEEVGEDGQPVWANAIPWAQTVDQLAQLLGERWTKRADNEIAADFFTAVLDLYREKANIDGQRETARLIKLDYGDSFWHNGYDPELALWGKCPHFVDVYKPDRIYADPKATRWIGNAYNGKFAFLETETTLRDLKAEHPKTAKDIVATDDTKGASGDEELDPLDRTIKKYLVYLADNTKHDVEEEYQEDPTPALDELGQPLLDETGQPVMTPGAMATRTIPDVPKYPSGWMVVTWCNEKVLDFGPAAEFPIHRDYCYEIPGQVFAHGVPDKVSTFNTQANRFYDQIIKNSERTGDNLVFVKTDGGITNPAKTLEGKATVVMVDGDIAGNVLVQPGTTAADGLFRALDLNIKMAEQIVGNVDAMSQENLPRTASGKYVYAAESGQQSRVSNIAKHGDEAERSLYRSIISQAIKNDTEETALKVTVAGQQVDIGFTPNMLDTNDFDMKWDAVLDAAPTESPDPGERNDQRKGLIAELSQMPKIIAFGTLDRLDMPDKEAVKAVLNSWYKQQEEQASAPQAPDPKEAAKAASQAAKDFTQAMQDISQALSTMGRADLGIALMVWAVKSSRMIAQGQDPDMTFVDRLMAEVSPNFGAGLAQQPAPALQPDPMGQPEAPALDPMTMGGMPQ